MSDACTSCGYPIPPGQFRCGKCGAVQPSELEDPGEIAAVAAASVRPPPKSPAFKERNSEPDASASTREPSHAGEEEVQGKEFVVPKGTFASEIPPQRDTEGAEHAQGASQSRDERSVEARGRESNKAETSRALAEKASAIGSSQRMRVARSPERPPFLASEILREDIAPKDPGRGTFSGVLWVAAGLGFSAMLLVGFQTLTAVMLAVLFAALVALGRLQLSYTRHASLVAALSASALVGSAWYRYASGTPPLDLLLTLGIPALSAALYLRSWYRNSVVARGLVALSLVPNCLWSFGTSHRGLLSLEFTWQSWLPAVIWYVFVILCLLSLLAFMGDETTAGCTAWAFGLCVWYGAYAGLRFALDGDQTLSARALGLADPALVAPLGVALAQLLSRPLGRRPTRVEPALTSNA